MPMTAGEAVMLFAGLIIGWGVAFQIANRRS